MLLFSGYQFFGKPRVLLIGCNVKLSSEEVQEVQGTLKTMSYPFKWRELKIEETCKPYKTIKNSTLRNSTMININKGDYDIITLDENDEIQVDDVSEQLESNNSQERKAFTISQKNYVIKCNLCNFTFLTVEQFQDHHQDEDHKKKVEELQ